MLFLFRSGCLDYLIDLAYVRVLVPFFTDSSPIIRKTSGSGAAILT